MRRGSRRLELPRRPGRQRAHRLARSPAGQPGVPAPGQVREHHLREEVRREGLRARAFDDVDGVRSSVLVVARRDERGEMFGEELVEDGEVGRRGGTERPHLVRVAVLPRVLDRDGDQQAVRVRLRQGEENRPAAIGDEQPLHPRGPPLRRVHPPRVELAPDEPLQEPHLILTNPGAPVSQRRGGLIPDLTGGRVGSLAAAAAREAECRAARAGHRAPALRRVVVLGARGPAEGGCRRAGAPSRLGRDRRADPAGARALVPCSPRARLLLLRLGDLEPLAHQPRHLRVSAVVLAQQLDGGRGFAPVGDVVPQGGEHLGLHHRVFRRERSLQSQELGLAGGLGEAHRGPRGGAHAGEWSSAHTGGHHPRGRGVDPVHHRPGAGGE